MKNRKMNLDRPQIDSKEIQAGMNFGQLMVGYQAMSKPFYKTNWFFGTTGLASIGLIVGGTFAFQSPDESEKLRVDQMVTDAPPEAATTENENVFALNAVPVPALEQPSSVNELTSTNETETVNDKNPNSLVEESTVVVEKEEEPVITEVVTGIPEKSTGTAIVDLNPRINGVLDGTISREDLFDNKGLTTGSDVSIIHFELHLIDGLGGKVFEEESNQLNQDMKNALHDIGKGETIYFENIKGRTSDGHVVRLNPLRYVLLN